MDETNTKIEVINNNNEIYAIIIRSDFHQEGINFFTPDDFSQQMGYMSHKAGHEIPPHIHNYLPREVTYTQEVLFSLSLILSKGCSVSHPTKEGDDKADSASSLAVNIDDRYLFDKFQQAECKSNSLYYPLLRQHFNDQLTQDIDLSGTRAASDKLDILLIEAWLSQGLQPKVIDFFDDRFSCEHTELRETPLDSVACFLREHSHYLPIGTTIRFTKLNIISGIKYHIRQLRNNACSSTLTRDSVNVAYEPDKYVVTGSQVDLTHVTAFVKRVLLPAVSAYHQYLCTPSNISLPTISA